jgi:hypothetical protein
MALHRLVEVHKVEGLLLQETMDDDQKFVCELENLLRD